MNAENDAHAEAVRLLVNNLATDAFCPDCAARLGSILARAGCDTPPAMGDGSG